MSVWGRKPPVALQQTQFIFEYAAARSELSLVDLGCVKTISGIHNLRKTRVESCLVSGSITSNVLLEYSRTRFVLA